MWQISAKLLLSNLRTFALIQLQHLVLSSQQLLSSDNTFAQGGILVPIILGIEKERPKNH